VDGTPLVVVAGPPAAGKTTVSRLIASRFAPRAVVIEAGWWWTTIIEGYVPAWLPEADDQNRTVVRSFAAAASIMVEGEYPNVLDGVIGPWFLDLVTAETTARRLALHYVALRPSLQTVLNRAASQDRGIGRHDRHGEGDAKRWHPEQRKIPPLARRQLAVGPAGLKLGSSCG
jgi:hypothetical protein